MGLHYEIATARNELRIYLMGSDSWWQAYY